MLTAIDATPHLKEFLNSLYGCQYKAFFKVIARVSVSVCEACGSAAAAQLHSSPSLSLIPVDRYGDRDRKAPLIPLTS